MRRRPNICPARLLADASSPNPQTTQHATRPTKSTTNSELSSKSFILENPHQNQPQQRPPPWWSPFGFLRDGTRSLKNGASSALGTNSNPSVFAPRAPDAGLLSGLTAPKPVEDAAHETDTQQSNTATSSQPEQSHRFPSWSSWKDWKKVTLDLYLRLTDRPINTRLRLKQTIALLPVVKLKPVIDLAYRGPDLPPVAMHLDVKLLDCIKYRVRPDGKALLQVRAKAPLSDPRFCMDVTYERDLATALESVKISFRALDVAFLKAPGFGAGVKYPIKFNNGIKSTLRVKKVLVDEKHLQTNRNRGKQRIPLATKGRRNGQTQVRERYEAQPTYNQLTGLVQRFAIAGPIGVDVKFRCLEYR